MILYDEVEFKKNKQNEGKLLMQLPKRYKESFKKMIQADDSNDYATMLKIGEKLRDEGCDAIELWSFLNRGYLHAGRPKKALETIKIAIDKNPKDVRAVVYSAICYQFMGNDKKAVEILEPFYPLDEYFSYFHATYAKSLEGLKKYSMAQEVYAVIVKEYEKGYNPGSAVMNVIFHEMIEMDMMADLDTIKQDFKNYENFLNTIEGTKEEQENIATNLVVFSNYLSNEKCRKPFKDLLDFISQKGLLKGKDYAVGLNSGYVAHDSYKIVEDKSISKFMKDFIQDVSKMGSFKELNLDKVTRKMQEEKALGILHRECVFRKYCCVKRMPKVLEEFAYIKEQYPHSYKYIDDYVGEISKDAVATEEKYLTQLLQIDKEPGRNNKQNKRFYDNFYAELYESGTVIWDSSKGDSYTRTEERVGRNAPCPCGSGKKYKKCCGK